MNKILPSDPTNYAGPRWIRYATIPFLLVVVARSLIHLLTADGGAQSIAGIDTSVEGGNNIIALFHQWGAIQLLLAILLVVLFIRYKGFTPLVLLGLALDPILREVAGMQMKVTAVGTPPGAALNAPVLVALSLLFVFSLMERTPTKVRR
jgi:hypothetical protein